MKGSFSTHMRNIAFDSILYGFRSLISHVFFLTRMLFVLMAVNMAVFMVFAGALALFFKAQYASLDLTTLITSYMDQCTLLNSCSLQDFAQVLREQLIKEGASIDILAAKAIAGVSILVMVQAIMFVWSSLGVIRIFLDIYDRSRSSVARLFSVIRYIPRAFGSLIICVVTFLPGLILGALGFYVAGVLFEPGQDILGNLFLIPAVVFLIVCFIRVRYFPFLIVDRDVTALQAVTYSVSMTRGFTLYIALQLAIIWLIRIGLSYIPLVGGIIELCILYPVEYLSNVYVYRYVEKNR